MTVILHTSDLQLGRTYAGFPEDIRGVLANARFETIRKIGEVAKRRGAKVVVVAGDVYDLEQPSKKTLLRPMEIMRAFPEVEWCLLPGNHDPATKDGLWDQLKQLPPPENVHLLLDNTPVLLEDHRIAILPAPLMRKRSNGDLTEWMADAKTPDGYFRIGVAHGPVVGFGSDAEMVSNLVPPDRAEKARLDYLALGDWHSSKQIGPRTWYSGTHETDRYKSRDGGDIAGGGNVLVVSFAGPGMAPQVDEERVGEFTWRQIGARLLEDAAVDTLVAELLTIQHPERSIVKLKAQGALSLAGMADFEKKVGSRFGATFSHFEVDADELIASPTDDDLAAIDSSGFVRGAAEQLRVMMQSINLDEARLARLALTRLYVEVMAG